jgi:glycosyltransferase involved in cell wall biosynthesis
MSNALLEAMAAGLPCIATDVGSNRSVLAPGGAAPAGLVTDVSADSLFAAMDTMARDAEVRAHFGGVGAAMAGSRYTIPAMVRQYEQLYRTVVGHSARPIPIVDTRSDKAADKNYVTQ